MSTAQPDKTKDGVRNLADSLRTKQGIPYRTAVVGDRRFEFIRGKDFARYFEAHDEKMQAFVPKAAPQKEQVKTLGELFIRRHLFAKAERTHKRPHPGRKRLVKWPRQLTPIVKDQTFQEEHFYAWQYERPSSPYTILLSALLAIVVLACCLFPLAPQAMKVWVVYASMALIIAIVSLITIRGILALASWAALGRSLWLFPHLLSEEKGLDEAFWPIFELDEAPKRAWASHWALRLGTVVAVGATCWAVLTYAPETGNVRDNATAAHDAILEMLNLHDKGRGRLGDSSNSSGQQAGSFPGQGQGPGRPGSFS